MNGKLWPEADDRPYGGAAHARGAVPAHRMHRFSADAVLRETGGTGQVSVLMPLAFVNAVTSDSRARLISAGFT